MNNKQSRSSFEENEQHPPQGLRCAVTTRLSETAAGLMQSSDKEKFEIENKWLEQNRMERDFSMIQTLQDRLLGSEARVSRKNQQSLMLMPRIQCKLCHNIVNSKTGWVCITQSCHSLFCVPCLKDIGYFDDFRDNNFPCRCDKQLPQVINDCSKEQIFPVWQAYSQVKINCPFCKEVGKSKVIDYTLIEDFFTGTSPETNHLYQCPNSKISCIDCHQVFRKQEKEYHAQVCKGALQRDARKSNLNIEKAYYSRHNAVAEQLANAGHYYLNKRQKNGNEAYRNKKGNDRRNVREAEYEQFDPNLKQCQQCQDEFYTSDMNTSICMTCENKSLKEQNENLKQLLLSLQESSKKNCIMCVSTNQTDSIDENNHHNGGGTTQQQISICENHQILKTTSSLFDLEKLYTYSIKPTNQHCSSCQTNIKICLTCECKPKPTDWGNCFFEKLQQDSDLEEKDDLTNKIPQDLTKKVEEKISEQENMKQCSDKDSQKRGLYQQLDYQIESEEDLQEQDKINQELALLLMSDVAAVENMKQIILKLDLGDTYLQSLQENNVDIKFILKKVNVKSASKDPNMDQETRQILMTKCKLTLEQIYRLYKMCGQKVKEYDYSNQEKVAQYSYGLPPQLVQSQDFGGKITFSELESHQQLSENNSQNGSKNYQAPNLDSFAYKNQSMMMPKQVSKKAPVISLDNNSPSESKDLEMEFQKNQVNHEDNLN